MARSRDERGVTVIFLALTITSILIAAAFVVDYGWWYLRAQQAQRAADAAALAAVVWMPSQFPKAVTVARETARANGFEHGVDGISVEVSQGGNDRQVAVRIVDSQVARFFSSIASKGAVTVGRRATAQYELPVPLGSAENQLGGGHRGVYAAVNGLCARRADGDNISSGYYNLNAPANTAITCQTPYETTTPAPPPAPVQKNPDYRADGYTYVVDIPPLKTSGCAVVPQPSGCTTTGRVVAIEVQDPKTNTSLPATNPDQPFNLPASGCTSGVYPVSTSFQVFRADTTPLDLTDNPAVGPAVAHGSQAANSSAWELLANIPVGSPSGQYLVKVRSQANLACSAWSNAFGLRARLDNAPWVLCSAITDVTCPQVHGLDAMSLRAYIAGGLTTCLAPLAPGNRCATFYLAQVDPVYAGRKMLITLFDPGEGMARLRVLQPDGNPAVDADQKVGFEWKTIDGFTSRSGSVSATSAGLDVTANAFQDRKLQLSVDLPDADVLSDGGGWFKIEYEVASTGAVEDRTTWGVDIPGSPVRLIQ